MATPPFHAVKLISGDIATTIGLRTDAEARALDARGNVIEGLFVAGNDAASFMGGTDTGAGITIGPAMEAPTPADPAAVCTRCPVRV